MDNQLQFPMSALGWLPKPGAAHTAKGTLTLSPRTLMLARALDESYKQDVRTRIQWWVPRGVVATILPGGGLS